MTRDPTTLLLFGEAHSNKSLAVELELDGYQIRQATNPAELKARCIPGDVELILLSAAPDPRTSLGVLRALGADKLTPHAGREIRVLWVCGTDEVAEVLRAFDAGADDVIRSPFVYAECLARVRALLRRTPVGDQAVIRYAALEIDTAAHEARFGSRSLRLRRLEYALLAHLAHDPLRVYTKDELLRDVSGLRSHGHNRTVDAHASRLRRKLALAGAEGWVTAIHGVGLRLAPEGYGELRLLPRALGA